MDELLKAVSPPRRRAILRALWDGERSAGDIHRVVGEITFGAVSQHLKVLEAAGVVSARRDGRQRIYKVDKAKLGPLARFLERMWDDALAELQLLAEAEAKGRRR
jgi:DNA-binding transcriptional ArsR family regulator